MNENEIEIITTCDEEVCLPVYSSRGASGADVRACIKEPLTIEPGNSECVPTGLFFEIPDGYEIQVRPRSGLALKFGITVLNTPGTIDSDYRGQLMIILINHGKNPFIVEPYMRIAQIVVAKTEKAVWVRKQELTTMTSRGAKGFGHTGLM